jgi:hypothetical protein
MTIARKQNALKTPISKKTLYDIASSLGGRTDLLRLQDGKKALPEPNEFYG